jgi:tetratricopeptide (TPR) repeat protein
MRKLFIRHSWLLSGLLLFVMDSCNSDTKTANVSLASIDLKRGAIISCGPASQEFGNVEFPSSYEASIQKDFNLGIALLHSFEYDEAEKAFAKAVDADPETAIGYWGVAMANFHPLWAPPIPEELAKGAKAIALAQSLSGKTQKEADYINALAVFYHDCDKVPHHVRSLAFEKAMENLHAKYPDDKEAATFYALALNGSADPSDKTFTKQRKAGEILTSLYPGEPDHPGIIHYIIHSYDYPELANQALFAARKYASVAPSSAHAQHMPSHIFTRLGLWDEDIQSNLASVESAKCYAESSGIKGHWDEEMHGLDYLVYSYLQKGDNENAKKQIDYLLSIEEVSPVNFKVAYAYAAIPARYALENKMWKEAAALQPIALKNLSWNKFPWQSANIHFAKLLGFVHTGDIGSAKAELKNLSAMHDTLANQNDAYRARLVEVQVKAGEAWIKYKEGNNKEAIRLATAAAELEESTQKHPVTPGEVIPARELLGDLLLDMNKPEDALANYIIDLKYHPNRFNGVYGAAVAAKRSGNTSMMKSFYKQLVDITEKGSARPEVKEAMNAIK